MAGNSKQRKPKLSREEKTLQTKEALIKAAAKVVGKHGYADASVSRITEEARVAQGTFYNYFETRQDILNLLPPLYATQMNDYIAGRMTPDLVGLDREVRRMEAFFEFFMNTKESPRLVNEAPVLAPEGFERFSEIVHEGYSRALRRSVERGELKPMSDTELNHVAEILISIRNGFSQLMLVSEQRKLPEDFLQTYRDFVGRAIFCRHDPQA